jgi:hypothetical protein
MSFEFPKNVVIEDYNDTLDSLGIEGVAICFPVAEAFELLKWLNQVPTGTMDDHQFMYFTQFKKKLQEAIGVRAAIATLDDLKKKLQAEGKTVGSGDNVHEIRGGFPGEG